MKKGVSSRVSKVNEELQKLACIIADNTKCYFQTKQALKQFNNSSISSNSEQFDLNNFEFSQSNAFSHKKISQLGSSYNQSQVITVSGCSKNGKKPYKRQQFYEEPKHKNQHILKTDMTIKKFKSPSKKQPTWKQPKQPMEKSGKKSTKLRQKIGDNKSKSKISTKLKSAKSDNKLHNIAHSVSNKNDNVLRKTKKKCPQDFCKLAQKTSKKLTNKKLLLNSKSKLHPLSISMIPQEKTNPDQTQKYMPGYQTQNNQHIIKDKLQLNLKKQVTIQISDLNIQKQLCQRQSQYLKASMRFGEQKMKDICDKVKNSVSEEIIIRGFIMKTLSKFLIQFFKPQQFQNINLQRLNEDMTTEQLITIIQNPHFTKYMLKLPTILNKNNTLCEDNCIRLFQEKRFIERKLSVFKGLQNDIVVSYFNSLYDYISFLLNNNMVHQTKRKQIPFNFNSERSHKQLPKSLLHCIQKSQHIKQYDSERKKQPKKGVSNLKRVKTFKTLTKHKSVPKNLNKINRIHKQK